MDLETPVDEADSLKSSSTSLWVTITFLKGWWAVTTEIPEHLGRAQIISSLCENHSGNTYTTEELDLKLDSPFL